ncbi:MAG: hypothetical protein LAT50_12155 [Ectothiorhodospiraceae bacterium]|nr:hypothetical protein [Ectothiorhodospiraceae bacterium]
MSYMTGAPPYTNAEHFALTERRKADVERCNVDKRRLREWRREHEEHAE